MQPTHSLAQFSRTQLPHSVPMQPPIDPSVVLLEPESVRMPVLDGLELSLVTTALVLEPSVDIEPVDSGAPVTVLVVVLVGAPLVSATPLVPPSGTHVPASCVGACSP